VKAKCLNWLLMAVLICGFSWSVTACSDDDDENKTSEQRNDDADPLDTDEAQVAWRWLCALTDAQKLESNWSKKSYEHRVLVISPALRPRRLQSLGTIFGAKVSSPPQKPTCSMSLYSSSGLCT
jgi:hypothetical protein